MGKWAYYNEWDAKTAAWLRELIKAKLIANGEVDTRSIVDVQPADLTGFTQCHFFAGIGGWSYALRLAGWPDDRACWTLSCPCQPLSAAGRGLGADDPRHLWPAGFRLIRECRPLSVFGEQVASADGLAWFDAVCADMEGEGYAVGAVDLCAAGVGAPHIRQRLYFVADAERGAAERQRHDLAGAAGGAQSKARERQRLRDDAGDGGHAGKLGDTNDAGSQGRSVSRHGSNERAPWAPGLVDWLPCSDGKTRPVEPGTFPLAHGLPARVGRLRGYGNAIVPQVAAEVIGAYMDLNR